MLEVGKTYKIRMIIGGDETTFYGTVEKYEHPIVKLADTHLNHPLYDRPPGKIIPGKIINVASPIFISAQEVPGTGA